MFFKVNGIHQISAASGLRCLFGAALINFFGPNAALIRGRRVFGGDAYSSKYGMVPGRNRTWVTLVGGECSNHCANPAPCMGVANRFGVQKPLSYLALPRYSQDWDALNLFKVDLW